MLFDLKDLEFFVSIANESSFTRAAEQLHVTQPVLSRRIRDLEKRLGVALFRRTTRQVEMTEAGRILHRYARSMLLSAAELEKELAIQARQNAVLLRIGYRNYAQFDALTRLVASMNRNRPDIQIQQIQNNALSLLKEGGIDAAIVMEQDIRGIDWIDWLRIDDSGLSVFAHADDPLVRQSSVSLDLLQHRSLLLPIRHMDRLNSENPQLHDQIQTCLMANGLMCNYEAANGTQEFTVRILNDRKLGIMPDSSSIIGSSVLVSRPIQEIRHGFGLVLIWRKKETNLNSIRMLRSTAEQTFMPKQS